MPDCIDIDKKGINMTSIKKILTVILATASSLMALAWAQTQHLEFLPDKSDDILVHKIEKRGFVSVPLDYAHPDKQTLKIFYRLIPIVGKSVEDDAGRPTIVVVNGGPGMASRGYRDYDYDYEKKPEDKLSQLTKQYRVLIMDQRGTPGNSTALNMNAKILDYKSIAKYFSADSIARDQEKVINQVFAPQASFYIISQSFGGLVGFEYMIQNQIKRKPDGIIFSSAAMPFEDPIQFNLNRRNAQKELNLQLKQFDPTIESKIAALKKHFSEVGIEPAYVNSLWHELGHGKDGEWQRFLIEQINKMLQMDKVAIKKYLQTAVGRPDMLNIILSSSNMTPGWTDLSLSKRAMADIPFEPWMLDECSMNVFIANEDTNEAKNFRRIDKNPPKPIEFGSVEHVKAAIHQSPVLFTFGGNDAMTPTQPSMDHMLANFYIPNKTKYVLLQGGHQAIFSEEGVTQLSEWISHH